jgi:hypothetical protein
LSLADTLAYLTHDYIEVRGGIYKFSNGRSILRNILEAVWFNKDSGNLEAMPSILFDEAEKRIKELLTLRAMMRREYYRHPDTAINEAMKERAIWLAYWTTLLSLEDIVKGGDNHLFEKIVEVAEKLERESSGNDSRWVNIVRALKSLLPAFTDNAIAPVYIPIPQDHLLQQNPLRDKVVLNRHGNLIRINIGGREVDIGCRLETIAIEAARRALSPRALNRDQSDSRAAAGGVVVVGPTAYADKGFRLGSKDITAGKQSDGEVVYGINEGDFIIGIMDDSQIAETICQYIYWGVNQYLFFQGKFE